MPVSGTDWALINAYADGELSREAAQTVEARLDADPALAAELDRLRRLKADLSGLGAGAATRRRRTLPAAALAAVLACLLLLGWAAQDRIWSTAEPVTVAALHARFSAEAYDLDAAAGGDAAARAELGGIRAPDLSSSNLTLVASRRVEATEGAGVAWHYRGERGCRLTLVAGPPAARPGPFALARRWMAGGVPVALVAEGMDPGRFAAIADFAEARTRETGDDDRLEIAVAERTASAAPCA